MAGFWDDPDVQPQTNNFFKFYKPGDEVSGTIKGFAKKKWDDDSITINVFWEDDETPALSASAWKLKQALGELKPVVGDYLEVRLEAEAAVSGKGKTRFWALAIKRQDGSTDHIVQKP